MNVILLEKTKVYTKEQLEKIYGNWGTYETNVNDYDKYKPSPDDSGKDSSTNAIKPVKCQTNSRYLGVSINRLKNIGCSKNKTANKCMTFPAV